MSDLLVRPIEETDYHNGYIDLLFGFTNYRDTSINEIEFNHYLTRMKTEQFCQILVIFSKAENKIIGAGTIFKLDKLHNNPVGQIEDVIIDDSYRGSGLGKLLIQKLSEIGLYEFNCYKIILNCLDKNIEFYKKCDFSITGSQMKLN